MPPSPAHPSPAMPRTGPVPPRGRPRKEKIPFGWLEVVVLAPFVMPALLFIPGAIRIRVLCRVATYAFSLMAFGWFLIKGKRQPGAPFPAVAWLTGCAIWLMLEILNPGTNSPLSGLAGATMNIAIMSPAFWVATQMISKKRLIRLLFLILLCNGASALVGLGQFYWPSRFLPPALAVSDASVEALSYKIGGGQEVLRPPGLGGLPGAAGTSGMLAAMIALPLATRPISWWKRAACLGLATASMAVIYYSQVRTTLVTLIFSMCTLMGLLAIQGDTRSVVRLGTGMTAGLVGAFVVALNSGGWNIVRRFAALLNHDPMTTYSENRGKFLEGTLSEHIWLFPFGAGLGRWGQVYTYFGNRARRGLYNGGPLWTEIQWTAWVYDGGIPLVLGYVGAIVVTLLMIFHVLRASRDRELAFWAAVIGSICTGILLQTLGYAVFMHPNGQQFWALSAALFAADRQIRLEARRQRLLASAGAAGPGPGGARP